jgi:hypothetical protein
MNAARRVVTVAEMQGRDLLRRRVALGLLVALPVAFYLASAGDDDEGFASVAGGIGMGWSMAGAALFSVLASRRSDPRLVLAGFRPAELLLGRLLLLVALALAILAGFAALIVAVTRPEDVTLLVIGLGLAALVGVPLGLAVAALLPRELEGTMTIIGVVGINMSLQPGNTLAALLPFNGPAELLYASAGLEYAALPAIVHGTAYALALFGLAVATWTRRVRVHRPAAAPK